MQKIPSLLEMLQAGVHFGHQTSRWHPKMEKYLFGSRNNVHVIDLEQTQECLVKALEYAKTLASQGKVILFVGTKRQSAPIIQKAAEDCGMPYITERWIGGLLTNFSEVKRRLTKYLQMKDEVATGEVEKYTKKEIVKFKKELEKMDRYLSGISSITDMPDALYVADMRMEKTALTEAGKREVPVIGVCDSNVNPDKAHVVIPSNDDAVKSIKMMAELVGGAIKEGKAEWEKNRPVVEKAPERKVQRAFKKEESI